MWSLPSLPLWASCDGGLEVGDAAPLRAGLEDAAVAPDRVVQGLAQPDRQAAGLLAVDVLAGLGRQDRGRGVPAVAGGDQHGVDVRPGQQLADVAVHRAVLVAVLGVDHRLDRLAAAGLHVADGHELHVRLGQRSSSRSCRPRGPMPITPSTIRSLAATAPSRPSARAERSTARRSRLPRPTIA